MNISYDWYRVFETVVACGSISSAGEKLYISQPAVSQIIKQLENALGCALLIRTAKGVKLTSEGEALYKHIALGLEQIRLGERRLESMLNLDSGEIRIGASDMTLKYYLLPYLEEFHRLYPAIKISITNQPTPDIMSKLKQGQIDFGVVTEPVDYTEAYQLIPVRETEDIFICGKSYSYLIDTCITPSELLKYPLILLEENTSARRYIETYFSDEGLAVKPEFELGTSSLIVSFVKRNLGIGCVVRDFAQEDIDNGSVFELKLNKKIKKRHICIIREQTLISKASEKLLEMLIT
jgi:DNA-binding transcriptional LysR family regulator